MNLKNVDRKAIQRSYRKHNFQRLLFIFHLMLPIVILFAFPTLSTISTICSILPLTVIAHIIWLFYYSRKEYRLRHLLGDKRVAVPIAKSPNYESPERVPQYIRTADGELLEIMEDEAAEFDIEPLTPDESEQID